MTCKYKVLTCTLVVSSIFLEFLLLPVLAPVIRIAAPSFRFYAVFRYPLPWGVVDYVLHPSFFPRRNP
jgi:hypothetical protein